jgi:8-oxo-dGTP pyrophosphatase MutT (NUDIX family)
MKNFPFKAINPDTGKEETFWYSRSIAVCITVFATDSEGNLCVLANKRGPDCPDFVGYWVCPCGYLDFNETAVEAVARECFEETGITPPTAAIRFTGYNDNPTNNRQNVSLRFTVDIGCTKETTSIHNEGNETTEIKWIPVKEIDSYTWAFNHKQLIKEHQKL